MVDLKTALGRVTSAGNNDVGGNEYEVLKLLFEHDRATYYAGYTKAERDNPQTSGYVADKYKSGYDGLSFEEKVKNFTDRELESYMVNKDLTQAEKQKLRAILRDARKDTTIPVSWT